MVNDDYRTGYIEMYGGFHSHESTPIAGWFKDGGFHKWKINWVFP